MDECRGVLTDETNAMPADYEYDKTNMNLANVMRGETTERHPTFKHYCSLCKSEFPCGPAFCTSRDASVPCRERDEICGGCYMRFLYD